MAPALCPNTEESLALPTAAYVPLLPSSNGSVGEPEPDTTTPQTKEQVISLLSDPNGMLLGSAISRLIKAVVDLPEEQRSNLLDQLAAVKVFREIRPSTVIKVVDIDEECGKSVIRRFELPQICDDESGAPSFERLMSLLRDGPQPGTTTRLLEALYYKDLDGDVVAIATTTELQDAFSQLPPHDDSLTLYSVPPQPLIRRCLGKICGFPTKKTWRGGETRRVCVGASCVVVVSIIFLIYLVYKAIADR